LSVDAAAVRTQVDRILASPGFARAERLRRFLKFVAESTLDGRLAEVKESVIGIEVFDRRPASYNTDVDPIVRVQAGRLRVKLAEYYEQEGANDALVIELPRGRYVPSFRARPTNGGTSDIGEQDRLAGIGNSVAVLPFINLSTDPDNEYFSDGLTEELIHSLASIPNLRVTARSAAFQFKGKGHNIREIGGALGVGRIVEGSVRKAADTLRVTVQLVNVADGRQLWSEKYDRTAGDILVLQDEIALAIRAALSGRLVDLRSQWPARRQTESFEAFNHYLKGRFHWNKRNERGFRTAVEHFNEAIRIDPGYGRAYSGLADCYVMLGLSATELPVACMPRAREAALRAIEIDDQLAEAHTSLAAVLAIFDWDRAGAERAFNRALALDPGYATLHHWHSVFLLAPGSRFDEAEDEIEWAEQLDPISLPITLGHALVPLFRGSRDGVIDQCTKALRLDSNYYLAHWFLGRAHDQSGNYQAATDALEKARMLSVGDTAYHARILGALGHAYGCWGRKELAEGVRKELDALSATTYVDPFDTAQILAGIGDHDRAIGCLERAGEERSSYLVFSNVWPAFEPLRTHPGFSALASRLSLGPPRPSPST
jgi:serine/threonine-protein kinase